MMSSLRSGLRCGRCLKGAVCVELAALWTPLHSGLRCALDSAAAGCPV